MGSALFWAKVIKIYILETNLWSEFQIADFGLSHKLANDNYYVTEGGVIPVKWTAPEAINFKKYSTASDVWSYGCLLYEMWTLGCKPFEQLSNPEVQWAHNGHSCV